MPTFNYEKIFSSLFTWLKLGASLTVLLILSAKLVETWQNTNTSPDVQVPTKNIKPRLKEVGLDVLSRLSGKSDLQQPQQD